VTSPQPGALEGLTRPAADLLFGSDTEEYRRAVDAALADPVDRWGVEVLALPDGPSFDSVVDYLVPLVHGDNLYLTESGMHYLPLTEPFDATSFALHVADGSQIMAEYTNLWGAPDWALAFPKPDRGGPEVLCFDFVLGPDGDEHFGEDLARLSEPALAEGWLPILSLDYTDRRGLRLRRESLATRAPDTTQLESYLRIEVIEAPSPDVACLLTVQVRGNTGHGDGSVSYPIELNPQAGATVYLRCVNAPSEAPVREITAAEFGAARNASASYWRDVLSSGAQVNVPDQRVNNAMRNLIVQNMVLGERYSVGNPYETVFSMEGHESVLALDRFGFTARAEECLDRLVAITNGAAPEWYESWERGTKLASAAEHYRLTGNAGLVRRNADTYLEYLRDMQRQLHSDPHGLMSPERYAWDIPDQVYGWHSQAVAWRGMRDIVSVLCEIGVLSITDEVAVDIERFGHALRAAMSKSTTTLEDGSAFVPVALFSAEPPHVHLTESRPANYWNLVAPYALASGIVEPRSELAAGLLRYMELHGAWLLGLTRFNGLYDPPTPIGSWREDGTGGYKSPGIDNAFGVQTLFFLADNDEDDRLALALYSKLAHGMTRGTYLDGEATTLGVCGGEFFRTTWYPPNSTSNAMFLEALRLILLRESPDDDGRVGRLDLAWATPRHWLAEGEEVAVKELPSRAGPVSYRISSRLDEGCLQVQVTLPKNLPDARLYLRLPRGYEVLEVVGEGGRTLDWSTDHEAVALAGVTGTRSMSVAVRRVPEADNRPT
jgi:hypothetical protein